jgi:hypothetical protein
MASTITDYTELIDINFPTPGEDNDSQGFRTNFSMIKSALDVAGDEISTLQSNLISLSSTNNFGGNIIKKAALENCSIILKNYTLAELSALVDEGTAINGTLVFVTDTYNCPAYYYNGNWYAISGTLI